uniref:Amino acid ABC transporter permease n=1 Tax=Candidatus Aschnera chinzeii TaxID=1485666 RepID=A0AAT9G4Y5_9ENTR|nr:MAG: amino acid ABC transporter permease [Candidatus Aschnera chinzeii]
MLKYNLINYLISHEHIIMILYGFFVTIMVSLCAIVISFIIGYNFVIVIICEKKFLNLIIKLYILLFRNTPLLIQLFFWYFIVPQILPSFVMQWLNISHTINIFNIKILWPSFEFLSGVVGLSLYSAAFIIEDLRGGIYGVPYEQKNAALALGFSKWQTMNFVILPQALKIAKSPLLSQCMNIIKNSSLTMAIGVTELSYVSRQIESESLQLFTAFGISTFLYIFMIAIIGIYDNKYQKNISKFNWYK